MLLTHPCILWHCREVPSVNVSVLHSHAVASCLLLLHVSKNAKDACCTLFVVRHARISFRFSLFVPLFEIDTKEKHQTSFLNGGCCSLVCSENALTKDRVPPADDERHAFLVNS